MSIAAARGSCGCTPVQLKEASRASLLDPFDETFDVASIPGALEK